MKPRQCGFVTPESEMSKHDRKIIQEFKKELANYEPSRPAHVHVWSNWYPKNGGEQRKCIECKLAENRAILED